MKLYYISLSLFVTIVSSSVSSSFAQLQSNVELENTLTRRIYYSIGSPADRVLNKKLEILEPPPPVKAPKLGKDEKPVNVAAQTLPEDIFQAGVEVLLSSKPGEAELFGFTPGKTVYVDIKEDTGQNVLLTPQSSIASSLWRKTKRGYPLSNNVTTKDIGRASLTSHDIPATNPQAFLVIYGPRKSFYGTQPQYYIPEEADPHVILGIPADKTTDKAAVNNTTYNLLQKWHPTFNKTNDPVKADLYKAVSSLIIKAASTFIPELKQLITQ